MLKHDGFSILTNFFLITRPGLWEINEGPDVHGRLGPVVQLEPRLVKGPGHVAVKVVVQVFVHLLKRCFLMRCISSSHPFPH